MEKKLLFYRGANVHRHRLLFIAFIDHHELVRVAFIFPLLNARGKFIDRMNASDVKFNETMENQ